MKGDPIEIVRGALDVGPRPIFQSAAASVRLETAAAHDSSLGRETRKGCLAGGRATVLDAGSVKQKVRHVKHR